MLLSSAAGDMSNMNAMQYGSQAIGMLGSVYGQYQANKLQKKYDNQLQQRQDNLNAKLNRSQYTNYLDTVPAKSALSIIRNNMRDNTKALANSAVQGGATPEAVIAQQGKQQTGYQNAVNSLLGQGENMKYRDKYLYESLGQNVDNLKLGSLQSKIQSWQNFGQTMSGAAGNVSSAYGAGAFGSPYGDTPTDSEKDDMKSTLTWGTPQGN